AGLRRPRAPARQRRDLPGARQVRAGRRLSFRPGAGASLQPGLREEPFLQLFPPVADIRPGCRTLDDARDPAGSPSPDRETKTGDGTIGRAGLPVSPFGETRAHFTG